MGPPPAQVVATPGVNHIPLTKPNNQVGALLSWPVKNLVIVSPPIIPAREISRTLLFITGGIQIAEGAGKINQDRAHPPTTAPTPNNASERGPIPTPSPQLWDGRR